MERLTEKKENGRFSYYVPISENITVKMTRKLAKFEDFMEAHGFENLEELECNIECLKEEVEWGEFNYNELFKSREELYKENQALKDRWEKLWDWICDKKPISKGANAILKKSEILDKMRELELADLIRRKEK